MPAMEWLPVSQAVIMVIPTIQHIQYGGASQSQDRLTGCLGQGLECRKSLIAVSR